LSGIIIGYKSPVHKIACRAHFMLIKKTSGLKICNREGVGTVAEIKRG
jgi:hypothetical protein